ncbi:MAG: redoxin domain-containing protein [Bdellovibrionales bacterium]|nr:redoxin domain-containing protein [Bdellovibrionales bacterium]
MKMIFFCFALAIGPWAFAYQTVNDFDKNESEIKVVVFLSSQCPCSNSHVEHLNQLNNKYDKVQLFGVMTDVVDDDNKKHVQAYYTSKNFQFPVLKDTKQTLVKRFKALKTPHTTLLKRQPSGGYQVLYEGGISDHRFFDNAKKHYLKENLEALAAGKKIKYTVGKSLGCYIRRL